MSANAIKFFEERIDEAFCMHNASETSPWAGARRLINELEYVCDNVVDEEMKRVRDRNRQRREPTLNMRQRCDIRRAAGRIGSLMVRAAAKVLQVKKQPESDDTTSSDESSDESSETMSESSDEDTEAESDTDESIDSDGNTRAERDLANAGESDDDDLTSCDLAECGDSDDDGDREPKTPKPNKLFRSKMALNKLEKAKLFQKLQRAQREERKARQDLYREIEKAERTLKA